MAATVSYRCNKGLARKFQLSLIFTRVQSYLLGGGGKGARAQKRYRVGFEYVLDGDNTKTYIRTEPHLNTLSKGMCS